jgi:hypothetical protein
VGAIRIIGIIVLCVLTVCASAFARSECVWHTKPPLKPLASSRISAPFVLSSGGDTAWVQVHTDSTYCPGDPYWGHGGEAAGGPGPLETWCFEQGDSCGTNPPWDTRCFSHVDVRAQPSPTGINFWHLDTYRADQRAYCGSYALWCGSDSLWTDGHPVECGTWSPGKYPGYGNSWNCIVQLTLPDTFGVANGCTLYFDPRYDTECKYDYFYCDVWNDSIWVTLAKFNATSNNPGAECGAPGEGNPDYWGNTDADNLLNCDWQERSDPSLPAFYRVIPPDTLVLDSGPMFRWRFVSDASWSDQDGRGNTDGAAFIDNVWVSGDSERYTEDFEAGTLDPAYWSLPDPDGVIDQWHMAHDADPPYEGGDGGDRNSCTLDSSMAYRARPESGYPGSAPWRNGWYYRLISPSAPLSNSGCIVEWDEFRCALEYTCDYTAVRVRFYDDEYGKWCPWMGYTYWICGGGCFFWDFNRREDVSVWYTSQAESMQFAWDLQDVSTPGDFCRGKHTKTDYIVDNVSIGFYDRSASHFSARTIDMLQDTFHDNLCGYNSGFDAYDPDTVDHYSGPPYDDVRIRRDDQLYLDVSDTDGLTSVELYGNIDGGAGWVSVTMEMDTPFVPGHPELGGEYYGTLCPDDFGLDTWERGTEVWYYVKATDELSNEEYFPGSADPASPGHTGGVKDYHEFSILPIYPDTYTGPRILLVDGYGRKTYDYTPCVTELTDKRQLEDIYEETLTDAGYCYDKFDISGAGSNVHLQPIEFGDYYDAVVWFCGPYFSNYLFDAEAQVAIRDYLAVGGKVVLCGDRIAYNMASPLQNGVGEDSLGGEFLAGVMGCTYQEEMEGAFDKPHVYAAAVETLQVLGSPVEIDLDTLVFYRECPLLRDMSYVVANEAPPPGYTAQTLLRLLNPNPLFDPADAAIYVESQGVGQCVFVDFDLSASANHECTYCSGDAPGSAPDFNAGTYGGRVELMRVILEDLFGLPSTGGGGPADVVGPDGIYRWRLAQNVPNPCLGPTEIRYEVGRPCRVEIKVYDALGRVVCVLEDGQREPGVHTAHWDGMNVMGERVSSGVYFYKIRAGEFTATRKMLVLR